MEGYVGVSRDSLRVEGHLGAPMEIVVTLAVVQILT